jgi:DUF177 domain-containing protein
MSRPGLQRADVVDANAGAVTGIAWERSFTLDELSRLREAGALSGTTVDIQVSGAIRAEHLELEGELSGQLSLTCQRCLQPVQFDLLEPIAVRVLREEPPVEQEAEYDYVIADPTRLDLRWLSEEQALLAMPLVPMHEPDECPQGRSVSVEDASGEEGVAEAVTQSPFANLRELLKKS